MINLYLSLNFIKSLEAESNELRREAQILSHLETNIEDCNEQFELLETKLSTGDFAFDKTNKIYDFDISSNKVANEQLQESLLFLKVNAFFDREQRDVYNLILIAQDVSLPRLAAMNNKQTKNGEYFIHENNYILLRLVIKKFKFEFGMFFFS